MKLQPRLAALLGRMLNALGVPGFVRDGVYTAETGTKVRVSRGELFTVVSVDGTDVCFGRLQGAWILEQDLRQAPGQLFGAPGHQTPPPCKACREPTFSTPPGDSSPRHAPSSVTSTACAGLSVRGGGGRPDNARVSELAARARAHARVALSRPTRTSARADDGYHVGDCGYAAVARACAHARAAP